MKKALEEKYIFEYIIEKLEKNKLDSVEFSSESYHHNSNYSKALTVLEHGILSMRRLCSLGIINLTDYQLKILDDKSSHINGIDGVSLSVVGLTDLYKGEDIYNPFEPSYIDYVISRNIDAKRSSKNYGNEFVTYDDIIISKIKSLDFRLINLINQKIKYGAVNSEFYDEIIDKYNMLIKIAKDIYKKNLKISMREMSSSQLNLDINKISKLPILIKKQ